MKNLSFVSSWMILIVAVLVMLTGKSLFAYPSGSPAGYTGSPGDGQHCVSCHGGNAATVTNWITSNIPASGYTAGTVYTITATVSGTGKKGFEVSPQSVTGAQLGILAPGSNNHLVGGTKYVTQNSSGSSSGTVVYNFSWTAPAAGTGTVTFYGAFTVGKQNTKLSTLVVSEAVALPLTAIAHAFPDTSCAGQTVQLETAGAGGSGTYTYLWSSVPPGFTSTLNNPVVNPAVTTQYTVVVSDGLSTANASVTVTVVPQATAFAGPDTTCPPQIAPVPYNGTAQNYSAVEWKTSGTGTFSAPAALSGNYTPSEADIQGGVVELTLKAIPNPPCAEPARDTKVVRFEGPSGISNTGNFLWFEAAPNPTDGPVTIRTDSKSNLEIIVTNLAGISVFHEAGIRMPVSGKYNLDLSQLPQGIYLIRLTSGDHSGTKKIVIR